MSSENTPGSCEQFTSEGFWSVVYGSYPDVRVSNKKDISGGPVSATVIYCPLYAPGSLEESALIQSPQRIQHSRVAGKLAGYEKVLAAMANYAKATGVQFHLNAVFANRGVLVGHPELADDVALCYHRELYEEFTVGFCSTYGGSYNFYDYDDLEVNFPQYVDLKKPPVTVCQEDICDSGRLIDALNEALSLPDLMQNNRDNRMIVKSILGINGLGFSGAYWLTAGYLAADFKIADIVGSGIYLVAERIPELFGVSKLTPGMKKATRVQIKA